MSRYTRALRKAAKVAAQVESCSAGSKQADSLPIAAGSHLHQQPIPASCQKGERSDASVTGEPTVTPRGGLFAELTSHETGSVITKSPACSDSTGYLSIVPGRDWVPDSRPGAIRQPWNDGWLWRDRIRAGDLAVIVANPGAGASTIACDWIARVTTGRAFPGCSPCDALPPSDVLLLNTVEDFSRTVVRRICQQGGDPQRVLLATNPLLDWGAAHSEFPPVPNPFLVPGESRVRLQTTAAMEKLGQFLRQRPSIRLVVIDHLKQHFRCDSERVFEGLMHDLVSLARELDIAFVLIQPPDAFRKAEGTAQFLKSDSLRQVARSIWRLATPVRRSYGERVLQCLKLSHPVEDQARQNWRIDRQPGGRLEWKPGTGKELYAPLDAIRQAALSDAHHYLIHRLQVNQGTMDFEELLADGRRFGIDPKKLREAVLQNALEALYEDSQDEIRKTVGWPDAIARLNALLARRAEYQRLQRESQRSSLLVRGEVTTYDAGPVEVSVTPSPEPSGCCEPQSPGAAPAAPPNLPPDVDASLADEVAADGQDNTAAPAETETREEFRFTKPNFESEGEESEIELLLQDDRPAMEKLLGLLQLTAINFQGGTRPSQAG